MTNIISFEGSDYSGKTSTLEYLSKTLSGNEKVVFNEGPVYPTSLTARLMILANQSDEIEREFLYTSMYLLDSSETRKHSPDERVVFQDRFWPSVVAYGRFLNCEKSIHSYQDFKPLFTPIDLIVRFSCSHDEKIKRSEIRKRNSVFDHRLLKNPLELKRLEGEIDKSLEGTLHIYSIDTTSMTIPEVAENILRYIKKKPFITKRRL